MTLYLEPLEAAVLEKLLEGEHPVLAALRKQIHGLSVKSRELTGAGFFTEFLVAGSASPAPIQSGQARLGDVEAIINSLQYGAGFLLYVDNGFLNMLEGYSYEEQWPSKIKDFSLRYINNSREEMLEKLEIIWLYANLPPGR